MHAASGFQQHVAVLGGRKRLQAIQERLVHALSQDAGSGARVVEETAAETVRANDQGIVGQAQRHERPQRAHLSLIHI